MPPHFNKYLRNPFYFPQVGDPEECRAIEEVMCKDRKGPLLIGSVKSNMGHAGKFLKIF
jgi:hypothetical protein